MAEAPQPVVPLATPAFIDADVACFFCGYNLRSLGLDAICPECGRAIQESLRHGWLGYADPMWLRRLRTGITIPLWMILGTVVFYFALVGWIMFSAISSATSGSPQPPDMTWLPIIMLPVALAYAAASLTSVWLLTSPEPVPGQGRLQTGLATWIRILFVGVIGMGLLMAVIYTGVYLNADSPQSFLANPGTAGTVISVLASILYAGAGGFAFLLLLVHLRRIARRNFKKGLAKLTTVLAWGSCAVALLWLVFVVGAALTTRSMAASFPPPTTGPAGWPPGGVPTTMVSGSSTTTVVYTGRFGTSTYTTVTTAPISSTTTSGPAGTTRVTAGPPPFPFRGGFAFTVAGMCLIELLILAWFVCIVVALFWFRVTFSRAIRGSAFYGSPG